MFRPEEFLERLRERPFRPFRIIADEGLRYDITHPDLVLVSERSLLIGFANPANPRLFDRVVRVALVHVVAMEELLPESAGTDPAANGSAAA